MDLGERVIGYFSKKQDQEHQRKQDEQVHRHQTEKQDQEHHQQKINETIDYLKKDNELSKHREDEFKDIAFRSINDKFKQLEDNNNKNIMLMGALYKKSEEHFNEIKDIIENIANETNSILKKGANSFDAYIESKPYRRNLEDNHRNLININEKIKEELIIMKNDIKNLNGDMANLETKYNLLLELAPDIKAEESFKNKIFACIKSILMTAEKINEKEILLLQKEEEKERSERNLEKTKQILYCLDTHDLKNLINIKSSIDSARALSGVKIPINKSTTEIQLLKNTKHPQLESIN